MEPDLITSPNEFFTCQLCSPGTTVTRLLTGFLRHDPHGETRWDARGWIAHRQMSEHCHGNTLGTTGLSQILMQIPVVHHGSGERNETPNGI